ncbi:MAG: ribonuclease HII [Rickettsiales bacterium]|nr:ribonuclease HII [Rickettsiales bacterium]
MAAIPTFDIENTLSNMIVAGCDEAGRGPLCGPVVAAAVIFRGTGRIAPDTVVINDSKKMTRAQREASYDWLTKNTVWAVGQCSPREIDEMNILRASLLAMKRAIAGLSSRPDYALIDGNKMPDGIVGRAIVKGDGKSLSIAAASIIAKVTRDRMMSELAKRYPQYGWDKNAGYPTAAHLAAIKEHGVNEHYRKTFAPVKNAMEK